jgi:hypothetical protein
LRELVEKNPTTCLVKQVSKHNNDEVKKKGAFNQGEKITIFPESNSHLNT